MSTTKVTLPNAIMLGEVTRLLQEGHTVVMMTKGNSMMPFIVGERDSVELFRTPDIMVGHIALAQIRPGHYVLHRIIAMDGDAVTLKGDGNLKGTEKCMVSDISGVVSRIIRPGKKDLDCLTKRFDMRSRRWRLAPYIFRRFYLAIYRRII